MEIKDFVTKRRAIETNSGLCSFRGDIRHLRYKDQPVKAI
jgi:hypothetical protein